MKSRAIGPVLVVAAVVATGLWLQGATPSVPTGQWQTGAALGQPRTGAVPVMLDDGRVLLIGGRAAGAPVAAVDVVNPDGSITAGIPLSLARAGHTAVRLADGSVLVAGGTTLVASDQGTVEAATATAEVLYAGATQWIAATGLTQARTGATATSLPDGRVLVAGGADDNGPLDTFEIYDPISTTFHPGGLLSAARAGHAAAVAGKTSVLVAGGHNASGAVGTADIIDADTGGVVTVTMTAARDGASATALLDGRVLVAGGSDGTNDLLSAEVIDPVAATTTATLPMGSPRRDHQALLLEHNATVLITGGTNAGAVSLTAEQFVAWENGFRPTNPPAVGRSGALTSAIAGDGIALLAAGQGADSSLVAPTELYGFATLKTDKDDYAPGEFVTITGAGWQPGELVHMVLRETGPNPDPDVPLDGLADGNGNFTNDAWAPDEHDDGIRFYLTATGVASTAQSTFTDAKPNAVSVTTQTPNPIAPGGTASYTVTIAFNGNNQSCTANLSVTTALPSGAVALFSPAAVTSTGANQTSTLTISTTGATPPGSTPFTVQAAGVTNPACNGDTATGPGTLNVVEPTTTVLGASPNPSVSGQSVTLTATVAQTSGPTIPNAGTVTFKDGASTLGTATPNASGVATLSTSALTVAGSPHSLTASYAGVTNTFGASNSNTVSQTVNQAGTSTLLTSSANPSVFGQSVTFTATVAATAPGAGTPTGTVTFKDGATSLGTVTLSAGSATFPISTLAVGSHSITAVYGGDTNFITSTSSAISQTVNQASTSTGVASSANPSFFGQSVTFTATVLVQSPGAGTRTGTVTFKDGATTLGTGTLNGAGLATFAISTLAVGPHSITAVYGGDTNFSSSTSSVFPQTVNQASTSTAVSSSANPSVFGQSVTFTATVTAVAPGVGTPTGTVTFKDGATTLGTGTLTGAGQATFATTTLAVGGHSITAVYGGDTNFTTSTSSALSQTVSQAGTTTSIALTSGTNPSTFGQSLTFTATVAAVAPGVGTATGTVTFKDGATTIGTGAVNGAGIATLTTTTLSAGTHSITAVYGGDTNFSTSTSSLLPQTVNQVGTTTSVVSGTNPSTFGQSVTFTATVTPATGTATPTGAVTFKDGATTLGTGTLNGAGLATFTTTTLAVGTHSITAVYGGDTNFATSTSSALSQTVNKGNVTFTIDTPSTTITYGTPSLSVSGRVNGADMLGGTITVTADGASLGPLTLNGNPNNFGPAALNTSAVPVTGSPYTISYAYTGDANFNSATDTSTTLTVNKANTTTAVSSSVNPSVFGQSVTFTATVAPVAPSTATPVGTATFMDGATTLGSAPLNVSGQATFTTSALAVAPHSITVVYSGNSNFNGSTSTALTQTVNKAGTTTSVASSANPSAFGQSVTFTATVAAVAPGAGTSTGNVDFKDGATTIGTGTLNGSGQATFTTSTLAVGGHTITAVFGGDANFITSTSGSITQTVNKADTTTTVSSSTNPSTFGQSVTFTATVAPVAPATGTPTGTVTFKDGAATLGTGTLNGSGQATFATSALAVGGHSITAVFGGDASFNASTSGALTQTVNQADTTTSVSSSANPSAFGQSVTFTATVAAVAPGTGTPTGTVTFKDGATPLGTGTLNGSGQATFATSALAVDGHPITAVFGGDANFNASTSGSLTQTVNQADTSTSVISSVNPSTFGQSVTFTATVSAVAPGTGTPTGTVTFKDGLLTLGTGVLSGGVATFSTSALTVGHHGITANFGGDTNFSASSSAPLDQVVDQRSTTTTVVSSLNPSVFGQTVTFTSTVLGTGGGSGNPGSQGSVQFVIDGGNAGAPVPLSANQASLATSALSGGTHTVAAVYSGGTDFAGSTGTLSPDQTVQQAATTTLLTSDVNPVATGQSVTFTATVSSLAGVPTGMVEFFDGLTSLGVRPVVAGAASLSTSTLTTGTHSITASFLGSTSFAGSTSNTLSQVVDAPPVATADTYALFKNTPLTVGAPGVLGNDNDPDGATQTLTVAQVAAPAHASSFALNPDGSFSYAPVTGYVGLDTFTYKVNDGIADGNTVMVTLTVLAPDASPVAEPDAYHVTSETTLAVGADDGVLNNDHGTAPVTAVLVPATGPTHASSFTLNADGSFDYTPETGFTGYDSFVYVAHDGTGDSNPALVTIAVVAADAATVLSNDGYTVDQEHTLSVPATGVLGNDAGATAAALVLGPLYGTVTLDPDGSFDYTPATGFSGSDSFFYRATDAGSNVAMVTVLVRTKTTIALTSNHNPSRFGQSVSFTATLTPGDATGTVQFKIDGTDFGSPVSVSGGVATSGATSALSVADHEITAEYSGDTTHTTATKTLTQSVLKGDTTTTINSDAPDPSVVGQDYTVTVTVSAVLPAVGTATGTVTVDEGDGHTCIVTLSGGSGSCTLTPTAAGSKTLTAHYEGDANFAVSTSASATHVVNTRSTTTALTLTSPVVVGQPSTVTVTVTDTDAGTKSFPTGTIGLSSPEATDVFGTCTLADATPGVSSCSTTVTPAHVATSPRNITATFAATSVHSASNDVKALTVDKASTTTTITNAAALLSTPTVVGESYTVQWAVAVTAPGAGVPTGTVTVTGGSGCTAAVAAGGCTVTSTSAGLKTLVATYIGDTDFNGSTAAGAPHTVNTRATTTAVGLSPSTVVVGQSSTVAVTVTDVESAGTKSNPTGTVSVGSSDGTDVIGGTCVLAPSGADKSTCSVTVTPHQVGANPHVLTATFAATSVHSTSNGSDNLTVNKASTTTTVTNAAALLSTPTVVGESYTVQWAVAVTAPGAGMPTGTVTVTGGSGCTAAVAAGQCTVTSTSAGSKTLVATYGSDADFAGSTSAGAPHTVSQADTTTVISADTPDPSVVGQAVTVSFNVTVNAPGAGTPTGNVTVSNGTTSCSGTVAAGQCILTFTTAGAHPLTATYAGDSNFKNSTSASEGHTVSKGNTDTAITSDTPDPTVVGETYSVAVTVGAQAPAAGTPGGTVSVSDGLVSCTVTLSGGGGSCNLASTSAGSKTLTATYSGDSNFNGSNAPGVAHTVNQAATTTALSSSVNPSRFGQSVTLTALVSVVAPGAGTPGGTVEFFDGATSLGTVPVNGSGQATFATGVLSVGSHGLTATYSGNSNYTTSTSSLVSQMVNKADTTTTISSDTPDPSVVGQLVTITYGVAVNAPGAGTPTGNVTVTDGTLSCVGTVAAGSCNILFTTAGLRSLTATYIGDSSFNGSATGSSAPHTVNKAATTTTITNDAPDPSVVNAAYTVNWSVTVNAPGAGAPTGTVTVSDGSAMCSAAIAAGACSLTSTTPGAKTLSAAFSGDGNFMNSSGSSPHNVQYAFSGFFAPVDNMPVVNKANAGQAIPIKWRLTDTNGVGISDPNSFSSLTVFPVACGAWTALPTDPLPDQQVSTSGLLYQGSGNWQYNWKTPKQYANSCMVARVTLFDGSTHDFDVSFK